LTVVEAPGWSNMLSKPLSFFGGDADDAGSDLENGQHRWDMNLECHLQIKLWDLSNMTGMIREHNNALITYLCASQRTTVLEGERNGDDSIM
jgi:hypothetical protein